MIDVHKYSLEINAKGEAVLINKSTGSVCNRRVMALYFDQLKYNSSKSEQIKRAKKSHAYNNYYRVGQHALALLHSHLTSIKQLDLIDWIISNMRPSTNKFNCTYSLIIRRLGLNRSTISKTYKILKETGLGKFHSGCIFINPELAMHGNTFRYVRIYNDYYNTSESWWKHPDTNDEFTLRIYT